MTDTMTIQEAVKRVVERCRKENPDHMSIPVDGAKAMEWLSEELTAAAQVGEESVIPIKTQIALEAATIERCAQVADITDEKEIMRGGLSIGHWIAVRIRKLKDEGLPTAEDVRGILKP